MGGVPKLTPTWATYTAPLITRLRDLYSPTYNPAKLLVQRPWKHKPSDGPGQGQSSIWTDAQPRKLGNLAMEYGAVVQDTPPDIGGNNKHCCKETGTPNKDNEDTMSNVANLQVCLKNRRTCEDICELDYKPGFKSLNRVVSGVTRARSRYKIGREVPNLTPSRAVSP